MTYILISKSPLLFWTSLPHANAIVYLQYLNSIFLKIPRLVYVIFLKIFFLFNVQILILCTIIVFLALWNIISVFYMGSNL